MKIEQLIMVLIRYRRIAYSAMLTAIALSAMALPSPGKAQTMTVSAPSSSAAIQSGKATLIEQNQAKQARLKTPISVKFNNVTVEAALDNIAKQTGIRLAYSKDVYQIKKRITLNADSMPAERVIQSVLQGTGLHVRETSSGEVLVEMLQDTLPQQKAVGSITGKVTDSSTGRGMGRVHVSVRHTQLSAITSDQGTYTIHNVPAGGHTLDIRLVGYQSVSRSVSVEEGKRSDLHVSLTPTATMLSEVVTSVTGEQRKLEIGNDVTTINVDSVMRIAPVTTVTDLLKTRVPGLTVLNSSGVPGAPSRLRLRGIGGGLLADSVGGATNDPIVIVDGIRIYASQSGPTDQNLAPGRLGNVGGQRNFSQDFPPASAIDQIDPNSIEKIEVFKGPSASALYGSDAANGVIVITTKRGQAGPVRVSMSLNQGVEFMPGFYAEPGYYPFCHNTGANSDKPKVCLATQTGGIIDSLVRFQALNEPRLSNLGRGYSSGGSATVSGGSQSLTYSVTGSMSQTLGLIRMPSFYQDMFKTLYDSAAAGWMRRPNRYNTHGISAVITAEPRQGLRTTLNTRVTSNNQQQSSAQLQLAQLASTYIDTLNLGPEAVGTYATRVTSDRFVSDFSIGANWDGWQYFPLTVTLGFSRDNRHDVRYTPHGITGGTGFRVSHSDTLGFFSTGQAVNNTQTARVNGTVFPGRRVASAVGFEITRISRNDFQASLDTLAPGISTPSSFTKSGQRVHEATTGGWFVEPRLNLNSRFFVNPGFRFDGNSASGSGGRRGLWSLFPKLNFSWIAVDRNSEAPLLGMITMLRPRLSFGVAGVQPAPDWKLRLTGIGNVITGGTAVPTDGLVLTSLGNPDLHPERTHEIEGGFDVDLLDNRITVSITQFQKIRSDAIEHLPVAPSVYGGQLRYYTNIGRVKNTGTELSLFAILIDNPSLSWNINTSLSRYNNKLVSLHGEEPYIDMGNGTRLIPGYPLYSRWSRPILGYSDPGPTGRLTLGNISVADSAVYVGQQSANFEVPVSTGVSLLSGRVSVNATFQYKDGLTQYNTGNQSLLENLYRNPNASLDEQAAALTAGCFKTSGLPAGSPCTDYGLIQTVSTLRFSSLSIGYNVPRSFAQRLRVPSITLSLQGSNLGLLTNYRGKDPDVNGVTVGDVTRDSGQLPEPRQWRLQVRLSN